MRRRNFLCVLGGAAAWPMTARAQQPPRLPTVGYMGSATPATQGQWAAIFAQRLQELGWTEGRNVKIEVRWAKGRSERFAEIAAEFVALKVNVIVTSGGVVPTVKQATLTIPIVFAAALDPVASGYVASLARPGDNITGLSLQSTDTVGKRLGFLREVVPDLRRLAIMTNAGNPGNVLVMREAQGKPTCSVLSSPHPKSGERRILRSPFMLLRIMRRHFMLLAARSLPPTESA